MDGSAASDDVSGASAPLPAPHSPAAAGADACAAGSAAVYDKQLAWKLHGQRKLQVAADALRACEEEQCSFAPTINRRPVRKSPPASPRSGKGAASVAGCALESPPLSLCSPRPSTGSGSHPTEAQESSILLHLARQERAREFAAAAHSRLMSALPSKDFSKPTKSAPFALSASNWTSRLRAKTKAKAPLAKSRSRSASARSLAPGDAWESERATLVAVLDAQRRELALRARAQADAARAAESFMAATQRFEDRLAALETRTADELRELRRLAARQAAASDLILRSLGLALPPEPPGGD